MSSTQNKKPSRFPVPEGFSVPSRAPAQSPQSRRAVPNFRSEFALSNVTTSNLPHPGPSKQKQTPRLRPLSLVELGRHPKNDAPRSRPAQDALVRNENAPAEGLTRILSPPPPPVPVPVSHTPKSTKILNPPIPFNPTPRPSTPPKNLVEPDLSKFRTPSHGPSRPSKPVSRTRLARAGDLWTDSGRADLFGLTLDPHGVQFATPMEKAIRRGLEVSPRKVGGIGKEIRYAGGGLAEQASQVIGKKTTALSLWRKSAAPPESANMFVQIEEIINAPKPPPQRGGMGMLLCLARCRIREGNTSVLILFSVPPYDAKNVAITDLRVGGSVGLWEPLVEVEMSMISSGAYLCSRFVAL